MCSFSTTRTEAARAGGTRSSPGRISKRSGTDRSAQTGASPHSTAAPLTPGNHSHRLVGFPLLIEFHGGGGNRTRVRGRTGQNVYKRSPPLNLARRPEADALPAGQPSLAVALWAIGSPSAPSPF